MRIMFPRRIIHLRLTLLLPPPACLRLGVIGQHVTRVVYEFNDSPSGHTCYRAQQKPEERGVSTREAPRQRGTDKHRQRVPTKEASHLPFAPVRHPYAHPKSIIARLGIVNEGQEIRSYASERERTATALPARCPSEKARACSWSCHAKTGASRWTNSHTDTTGACCTPNTPTLARRRTGTAGGSRP
jgi:hypothetical protein